MNEEMIAELCEQKLTPNKSSVKNSEAIEWAE